MVLAVKGKYRLIILSTILVLMSPLLLAENFYEGFRAKYAEIQSSLFLSRFSPSKASIPLQLGVFFSSPGRAQNIYIQGLVGDYFAVNSPRGENGLFGVGYYGERIPTRWFDWTYGINAYYLAHTTVTGTITQEQLYTNLAYSYAITNYPIYLATKALLPTVYTNTNITLDLGIGPNIIRTNNFAETSIDGDITLPDQAFSSQTKAAFSATAGVGLRLNHLFGQLPLECGYRFFYLGQGGFHKLTDQLVNSLGTGNNYANAVVCTMTL